LRVGLVELRVLELFYNQLRELPEDLAGLPSLQVRDTRGAPGLQGPK
jgi:hypothetical protein